jgi:outer membrane receptor protein involved in Fe transport
VVGLGRCVRLTVRLDVNNLFGEKNEIRIGTGVGAGTSQWCPRRNFFAGFSKAF